ncbi:MAG TPA: HDOD domain-containing protein [Syntrophorhabdaceae bacterium]|nr:HDOD domain-containing protein [Syntrophorhabdaceae bacterium]
MNRATDLKVIPTLNGIVEKVFHVLGNNNSSFNDLCDVVQYDQAISSKIISIANSAYYSRGVEIFNLQRAMLTIGFEEVRGIVTCLMFMENILKKLKLKEQDLFTLWKHAIEVACGARTLSERMILEDAPKVYTVSLLHDLGKIVFYLSAPDYGEIMKQTKQNGKDTVAVEKEYFGIDHQELGYMIAVKWKFPHDFAHVIRYHHTSEAGDKYTTLFRLVNAANRFTHGTHNPQSPEGFILEKEKDNIGKEVDKIMDFLQLS